MNGRFGYLSERDREYQAETFVRYCERTHRPDALGYFDWWAGRQNKDFHPADAEGIRRRVREIMQAGGAATFVDPFDFLRPRTDEPAA